MRQRIIHWIGREFVALEAEGSSGPPSTQLAETLDRMDTCLRLHGLDLTHTVRTRLWARDRVSRDEGSRERARLLTGAARSASSSYVNPDRFEADGALVALDLLAMHPARGSSGKAVIEYDPPIVPLRYLIADSMCFLSGVTTERGSLDEQVAEILPRIRDSLKHAGIPWAQMVRVAAFLHRSQRLDHLERLLRHHELPSSMQLVFGIADGYSTPGKLVEIEVTALA